MNKYKTMTLEKHMDTADDLAIALHHLNRIIDRCHEHYPKSGRLMKLLYKVYPNMPGVFIKIKSELDNEYHQIISDEEFQRLGNIYYNLDERYKKLQELV